MRETRRISVRTLKKADARKTYKSLLNVDLYKYIPESPPSSIDDLENRYAFILGGSNNDEEIWLNWVVSETSSDSILGTLQSTISVKEKKAYIAYVLFKPFWGLGYGYESVKWLIEYLESQEDVCTIVAEIDTANERSIKLIRKHEFVLVDTIPTDTGKDHVYEKRI